MRSRAGSRARRLAQDIPLSLSHSLSLSQPLSPSLSSPRRHSSTSPGVWTRVFVPAPAPASAFVFARAPTPVSFAPALRLSRFDQGPPSGTVACDIGAPGWAVSASGLRGGLMDGERLWLLLAWRRLLLRGGDSGTACIRLARMSGISPGARVTVSDT